MSIYEQYPRGAMLINHSVPEGVTLPGDFVVGYMGGGETRANNFTNLIQAAADSKLPFLAFYDNDPGVFLDQYQSLNPGMWQEAPALAWAIKNCINPSLMAGSAMRTVHGVIIGMNKLSRKRSGTGQIDTYPDAWVVQTAEFVAWAIWKLYKLPTWFYIDPAKADTFTASPIFTTFLSGQEGISTYVDTLSAGGAVTELPYPPDAAQATLRAAIAPTLGHAPKIDFWCYSTGDYSLSGVAGVAPLFTYLGSKAALYDLLGWKVVTEPEPDPDPEEPEPTGDLAAVLAALTRIEAKLDALSAGTWTVSGNVTITK